MLRERRFVFEGVLKPKPVQAQHRRCRISFDHAYMRVGTRTDRLKCRERKEVFQSPLEEFFKKTIDKKRCIAFMPAHSGLLLHAVLILFQSSFGPSVEVQTACHINDATNTTRCAYTCAKPPSTNNSVPVM